MSAFFDAPIAVGKHTVCPFAKPTCGGQYAACVSIRGGQGRSSVDHVLRFAPLFGEAQAACRCATEQAMLYLNAPAASCSPCA